MWIDLKTACHASLVRLHRRLYTQQQLLVATGANRNDVDEYTDKLSALEHHIERGN